jgi:hypothetical protein
VSDHSSLAQIHLPFLGLALRGTVTNLQPPNVTIHLQETPQRAEAVTKGLCAAFLVLIKGQIHAAKARIVSCGPDQIALTLETAPRILQRRHGKRHACNLDVAYRVLHSDGNFGPWQEGVAKDIGLTGMCLHIEPRLDVPRRLELKFFLETPAESVGDSAAICDKRGRRFLPLSENPPFHALARVCHSYPTEKGFALGMAFCQLSPVQRLNLAAFTSETLLS